jgi:hypothetical protein
MRYAMLPLLGSMMRIRDELPAWFNELTTILRCLTT